MKNKVIILSLLIGLGLFSGCEVTPTPTVWIPSHYVYYPDGSYQYIPGHYEVAHQTLPFRFSLGVSERIR